MMAAITRAATMRPTVAPVLLLEDPLDLVSEALVVGEGADTVVVTATWGGPGAG